jgi:hypothetical protein
MDDKSRLRYFVARNKVEHLFSIHAIRRMYDRHSDYEIKNGKAAFRRFVNAQLFSSSNRLLEIEYNSPDVPPGFGVDGGAFLIKRNEEGSLIIATFISDDQIREDQEELAASRTGEVLLFQLASTGSIVLSAERWEDVDGQRCRVTDFNMWAYGDEGLDRIPTTIVGS